MTNTAQARLKNLGEVEQLVMDYVWTHGPSTAEACREALASSRPMKDSTIRTVLRRLEEKGYLTHEIQGRTFIYRASDARQNVAVRAVKGIIDRFCGGSAEALLLGMVEHPGVLADLEGARRADDPRRGAAVGPADEPVAVQAAQVPADGHLGNPELAGQAADLDRLISREPLQDLDAPLDRKHPCCLTCLVPV